MMQEAEVGDMYILVQRRGRMIPKSEEIKPVAVLVISRISYPMRKETDVKKMRYK